MEKQAPTHSKIGASSCERWWNCPGSVQLIETIPPQPSSSYAAEGTAAHEMAELCLIGNYEASELVGALSDPIDGKQIEFTEEMAEAVQVYLDTIRADMDKYKVHISDLAIEHKFHLVHIDDAAYGTNDANLKVAFTKIIVYDYKHGSGIAVEVEDNRQGLYYGVGAAYGEEFDEMEIVIVQPRAIHRDGPVRRWSVTKAELDAFGEELKTKIAATREPNAPRKCGDWCKKTFCAALSVCPEVRKQVETAAMTVFKGADMAVKLPQPEALTALQLRHLLENIPLLDAWTKSIMAYAENQMNNGQKVLGFKLVRGREGHRKWAVNDAELKAKYGLLCIEEAILSPAKLEKRLGKPSKEAKKEIDLLTQRTEGRVIMVPENDPREEVNANVIDVFKQEEEQLT